MKNLEVSLPTDVKGNIDVISKLLSEELVEGQNKINFKVCMCMGVQGIETLKGKFENLVMSLKLPKGDKSQVAEITVSSLN